MKVLVSFARMTYETQDLLYKKLKDLGMTVKGVLCHGVDGDSVRKLLPEAEFTPWTINFQKWSWDKHFDIQYFNRLIEPRRSSILPTAERGGSQGNGFINAETRLAVAFSRAHDLIKRHNPNLLLFGKEPEIDIENCLYLIARDQGLPTIFTRFSSFSHVRAASCSWETDLLDENWKPSDQTLPVKQNSTDTTTLSKWSRIEINRILEAAEKYIPEAEKSRLDGLRYFDHWKALSRSFRHPKQIPRILRLDDGPLLKGRLLKCYRTLESRSDVGKGNGLRIYFPLHYQPELTTFPRGGDFANQEKVVKILSDGTPDDARIFIKEHRATFSRTTQTSSSFRNTEMYHRLSRIPKVELRPIEEPSGTLQEAADWTAAITGTAGLEAMIRGRKVLLFGMASYANGPGVYRVSTEEDVNNLIQTVSSGESDREEAVQFIGEMEAISNHRECPLPIEPKTRAEAFQEHCAVTLVEAAKNWILAGY